MVVEQTSKCYFALALLQSLPSLPQALDDDANDADVEEDDDDEIEIVS